jgi:hypothetical protein
MTGSFPSPAWTAPAPSPPAPEMTVPIKGGGASCAALRFTRCGTPLHEVFTPLRQDGAAVLMLPHQMRLNRRAFVDAGRAWLTSVGGSSRSLERLL